MLIPEEGKVIRMGVPEGKVINNMPERTMKVSPCVLVVVFSRIAVMTASSTSHQSFTILGLDVRQACTRGASSSSWSPISRAPMAFNAPTLPP